MTIESIKARPAFRQLVEEMNTQPRMAFCAKHLISYPLPGLGCPECVRLQGEFYK